MTKKDRWILSEFLVARDLVERAGDSLLYHRQVTPYAELDLVFDSPRSDGSHTLTIVEVKTVGRDIWGPNVISRHQRLRLERARTHVEKVARRRTLLKLACVEPISGTIRYFDAPF